MTERPISGTAGRRRRVLLLSGEAAERSAPVVTLATALETQGVEAVLPDTDCGGARWLRQCRRADALVLTQYGAAHPFLLRQLHLASLAGCRVIRWWVGTDVLLALDDPAAARRLDAAVDLNVAVAPHLVDELSTIGIGARHVPSVYDLTAVDDPLPDALPPGVLAYLPTRRHAFYGMAAVEAAARASPDLPFVVVGDEAHALAHLPNVDSLGWVGDMAEVWPRIGCVLRITEHDGLPRMILEALARGRHVIYAWPLEGCRLARSAPEVQAALAEIRRLGPNTAGREAARRLAADAPAEWAALTTAPRRRPRLSSLLRVAECQIALKRAATAS